jgi:hypothetical protein
MPAEFTRLHESFDVLAEQLTAPGRIDIDRALTEGRRMRARRRAKFASLAAVSVAVTAALALTATNLLGAPDRTRQFVPTPPAASARTSTDPFAVGVSFGYLPAGMRASGFATQANGKDDPSTISVDAQTGGPNSPVLNLATAPAGPRPTLPLLVYPVKPPAFTAGPSINGRKSYVEYYPGTTPWPKDLTAQYYLMWQFDDGSWAILDGYSAGGKPLSEAEILHVAETVTEKPTPIPEFFQIDGALAKADIVGATAIAESNAKLDLRAGTAEIDITVGESATAKQGCKTTPLLGPAERACIAVRGTLPPSLAPAGIQGLLKDITLVQFPTTDVIR